MDEQQLSRRQFLSTLAIAAGLGLAGGAAAACGPLFAPSIDSEYLSLGRPQRALSLIGGLIPESWQALAPHALMPRLEAEIASVVLPEVSAILGGDAQDIVSHLEYYTDEVKLQALVQNYGESNSTLASMVAKQGVGITVSRFSETEPVPDKRIAINLNKIIELGQAGIAQTQVVGQRETNTTLAKFVVQSVVDAVIHEAIHYTMELDRLPEDGDLKRLQAMYAGGAIGTVEVQRLLYYEGAQIVFISRGGYKYYLNKALTEIFRAYVMQRLLEEMGSSAVNPPARFRDSIYLVDTATNEIMDFLHGEVGIDKPPPPLAVFKNDLLRIVDYYQDPATVASQATTKKVRFTDNDFVRIFGLMESLYASLASAIAEAGGREVMPAEMTYRAKLEIEKVISAARERT